MTGTINVGSGTIGTTPLNNTYPVEEGLEAGTTKQTGNPSLVAQEERTW